MLKYILGLNAFHGDAAACLLKDGELISAAEEERFVRIKHIAGFPKAAISHCLEHANITMSEIDLIAINSDPKANYLRKIFHVLNHRVSPNLINDRIQNSRARKSLKSFLKDCFPSQSFKGELKYVNHHLAHLSSAFYASPYEEAVVVSIDGFGDFSSGCWGLGLGTKLSVFENYYYPHSLGVFYQSITQLLGFKNYGDEYKVMGLAPYGNPKYVDDLRSVLLLDSHGSYRLNLEYFVFHKQRVAYEWENGSPIVGRLYSDKLEDLLVPTRKNGQPVSEVHMDIAASAQQLYEEALFNILNSAYKKTGIQKLCLSGGCGNNSVANGKIRSNTNFENIYVPAAAGDAGGAIGAAFYAYYSGSSKRNKKTQIDHAYWGPKFSDNQIFELLSKYNDKLPSDKFKYFQIETTNELTNFTAEEISQGKVVGWFQGRMEWGPRALGNRSILGDPRNPDMKKILNEKIKKRESFRPFAPSILVDHVSDWFEQEDDVPFMMKVLPIKKKLQSLIPAVTHVDGSGRLQTVHPDTNPRYYQLISAFFSITGVPMVLNTSFNENEPVVCEPHQALDCFLRTEMDVLVLNNYVLKRV